MGSEDAEVSSVDNSCKMLGCKEEVRNQGGSKRGGSHPNK